MKLLTFLGCKIVERVIKTMETDNEEIVGQQVIPNLDDSSDFVSYKISKQEPRPMPIKCELELIPVVAGECRTEPTSITKFERSLIRSSSAEVWKKKR